VGVAVPRVQAVPNKRPHVMVTKQLAEGVLVISLVSGETAQVARRNAGDLPANHGIMPPFGRGLHIKDDLGV